MPPDIGGQLANHIRPGKRRNRCTASTPEPLPRVQPFLQSSQPGSQPEKAGSTRSSLPSQVAVQNVSLHKASRCFNAAIPAQHNHILDRGLHEYRHLGSQYPSVHELRQVSGKNASASFNQPGAQRRGRCDSFATTSVRRVPHGSQTAIRPRPCPRLRAICATGCRRCG